MLRRVEDGSFPQQVQISKRCMAWRESSVRAWLANPSTYREQ
ncbi:helix-turn-helix transcriptional regulator [Sphingomonas sp.]